MESAADGQDVIPIEPATPGLNETFPQGYALTQLGQRDRALEWIHRARAIDPDDQGVLYNVACSYALLGETEEAMQCLERAILRGFGHKEWLEHDADLDVLRSDPRFQALLKKV